MSVTEPGARPQILVVEDNEDVAALFSYALESAGYSVIVVPTTRQASAILQNTPVSLVLTDWNLPDGTALDVCHNARQENHAVPIILVSGQADLHTMQGSTCHIDAWLSKPVLPEKLISTVRQLIEQHPQQ